MLEWLEIWESAPSTLKDKLSKPTVKAASYFMLNLRAPYPGQRRAVLRCLAGRFLFVEGSAKVAGLFLDRHLRGHAQGVWDISRSQRERLVGRGGEESTA